MSEDLNKLRELAESLQAGSAGFVRSRDFLNARHDFIDAANPAVILELFSRLQAAEERAGKAEGDRDALRAAIGFKPGPLKADRDDDIVIIDAKALRPAMVEARRQRDDAQSKLWDSHAYAAEVVRAWVKERFGKWITHKTAWTLAYRIFGSERAALKTEGA